MLLLSVVIVLQDKLSVEIMIAQEYQSVSLMKINERKMIFLSAERKYIEFL